MKLIVGLGNPGREYARTRHNIGFRVLDMLAQRLGAAIDRRKFKGEYGEAELPRVGTPAPLGLPTDSRLLLVKPQTYMNLSGETVLGFEGYFKTGLENVLVVLDDVALPLGVLRLRRGGSDGGHNGLRDITLRLGSQNYARLRVGVGGREEQAARPAEDLAGHVLSRFSAAEEEVLKSQLPLAVDAALSWAELGVEAAMNKFNRKA